VKTVCFFLKPEAEMETAWTELENAFVQVLYSDEEWQGNKKIFGILPPEETLANLLSALPSISKAEDSLLPEINWEEQWKEHGRDFRNGFVHVSLKDSNRELKLAPGPGFGDLSHPTTSLALEMMPRHVQGQCVIDVGCGSGILALAAAAMGAESVFGIDIDEKAIEHANKNAELNQMSCQVHFSLNAGLPKMEKPVLILINMISSEQREAWASIQQVHPYVTHILSSGIPKPERAEYLRLTQEWGWILESELEKEGWLGFCFVK
jgi:ribosomal protein L11 methyltransferase